MIQKLEGLEKYKKTSDEQDAIGLLKLIKNINFKFEDQTYVYGNIYNSMRRLYNYSKAEDASITQHKEKLDGLVKIVDQFGDLANTSVLLSQDVEVKKAFTVAQKVDPSTEEGQKAIEAYNNAKDKVK